jgi:hypothetical protein
MPCRRLAFRPIEVERPLLVVSAKCVAALSLVRLGGM